MMEYSEYQKELKGHHSEIVNVKREITTLYCKLIFSINIGGILVGLHAVKELIILNFYFEIDYLIASLALFIFSIVLNCVSIYLSIESHNYGIKLTKILFDDTINVGTANKNNEDTINRKISTINSRISISTILGLICMIAGITLLFVFIILAISSGSYMKKNDKNPENTATYVKPLIVKPDHNKTQDQDEDAD